TVFADDRRAKKRARQGPLFMNGNSARLKSVRLSRRRVSWIAIAQTLARDLHAQRERAPQPELSRLCAASLAAFSCARLLRDREAKARPRMARMSLAFSRMSFGSLYRSMISQSLRSRLTAAARARGDSGRADCFGN